MVPCGSLLLFFFFFFFSSRRRHTRLQGDWSSDVCSSDLVAKYVPTPVLSPWNGGSGFGAKDVEPKRRIAQLKAHPSPRLAPFRAAITVADAVGSKARAEGWIGDGGKSPDKARAVQEFR